MLRVSVRVWSLAFVKWLERFCCLGLDVSCHSNVFCCLGLDVSCDSNVLLDVGCDSSVSPHVPEGQFLGTAVL